MSDSHALFVNFYYELPFREAHFCLWLSHAAWIAEVNINILQVPQRQPGPKTTIISRLEVSCRTR